MKIEEMTSITVKTPNQRERKVKDYWNLSLRPELKAAIKQCLESGEEKFLRGRCDMVMYHIRPEYPLIPEAMDKEENRSLMKVSISVFHAAFHLGIRGDSHEQTEQLGSGPIPPGQSSETER